MRIASDLTLPLDALMQTVAILAKRGVGKTYTSAVITEEILKTVFANGGPIPEDLKPVTACVAVTVSVQQPSIPKDPVFWVHYNENSYILRLYRSESRNVYLVCGDICQTL